MPRALPTALLGALLAWLSLGARATADDATALFDALVPRSHERVLARARGLEAALVPALEALSGVSSARVALDLPDGACLPLDQPLPSASASVLLVLDADASVPDEARVRELVRGAARELASARVKVTPMHASGTAPAREPLVSVGPFRVALASASGFRLLLALSLLANVTLATVLLVRTRRKARVRTSY